MISVRDNNMKWKPTDNNKPCCATGSPTVFIMLYLAIACVFNRPMTASIAWPKHKFANLFQDLLLQIICMVALQELTFSLPHME